MSDKWKALLAQLERAVDRFREVLKQPKNEFMRNSAIQRFEFCFDLSWKIMKGYLEERIPDLKLIYPKETIREAFQKGLVEDNIQWMVMVNERNLTSHTYNEPIAEKIYDELPEFLTLYEGLLKRMKKESSVE